AKKRKHIIDNPATLAEAPNVRRRERPAPDADRIRRLLAASQNDARLNAFVLIGVGTGLRRAEAMGLQWQDVDFERGTVSVRRRVNRLPGTGITVRPGAKSKAGTRTVAAPPMTLDALRRLRATLRDERMAAGKV